MELKMRQVQQSFKRDNTRPFTNQDYAVIHRWLLRYVTRRAGDNGVAYQPVRLEAVRDIRTFSFILYCSMAYAYLPGRKGEVLVVHPLAVGSGVMRRAGYHYLQVLDHYPERRLQTDSPAATRVYSSEASM